MRYIPSRDRIRCGGYESTGDWNYAAPGACEQLAASVIRRLWSDNMASDLAPEAMIITES